MPEAHSAASQITSGCRVTRAAAQNIASGAWTQIQLTAETFDIADEFDSVVGYDFTTTDGGYYAIFGICRIVLTGAGNRYGVSIDINGAQTFYTLVGSGHAATTAVNVSAFLLLAAGDTVELSAYQESGAGQNVTSSELQIVRIFPA